MKSVLIIGLGRFGRHMALKLHDGHHDVLAVDADETRVNAALPLVTNAEIGNGRNEQFIASLGVRNFDMCVCAIGDDFQSSLETTALLKQYGAPFVLARASSGIHAKFLLRNGADRIVYPEKEIGEWAAVRYGSDNVFDFISLTPEYSIYETPVPKAWTGKTILDLEVRRKHGVSILATKRGQDINTAPTPDYVFSSDETLVILGKNTDIKKLFGI